MNNVTLIGRLTKDPVLRNGDDESRAVCRYTLAVGRPARNGEVAADYISVISFGKAALMASKYFRKGIKIGVTGQIRTGRYEKDGRTIYTTDVVASLQEFCERKQAEVSGKEQQRSKPAPAAAPDPVPDDDGFCNIPEDIDEYLPFN